MRKKDILGNLSAKPDMPFIHTIKEVNRNSDVYSALIEFQPGCKDEFVEAEGKQIQWAGSRYKMLMYLPINEFWCLSAYYAPDGKLLFWYFDISRKNFVDEHGIPCIDDIFLDLVITPDGQTLTLDADELQDAFDKNEITTSDFDHAYKVHDEILNSKWCDVDHLNQLSKKLLLEHEIGDIPQVKRGDGGAAS